jgi:hypothetical protein
MNWVCQETKAISLIEAKKRLRVKKTIDIRSKVIRIPE